MPSSTAISAFWRGARDALPFTIVVGPFGLVFGVVATEAGLDVIESFAFSFFVIAGASQFAALQQMSENAPTIIVVLTALAVNLRMAMYSASLLPWLGAAPLWQRAIVAYLNVDQTYAQSITAYERHPDMPLSERLGYFFGLAAPVAPTWYAMTLVGALAGQAIPPEYALDFAVPIAFIAVIAPMMRTLPHLVAALTSIAGTLALAPLPYNTGLLVAAVLAMAAGAETERRLERARA